MLKQALLLLFGLLTISTALDAALTKSYFFVDSNNILSYKMFQTNNGIIAYGIATHPQPLPEYMLFDIQSGNSTKLPSNISSYCGQGPTAFGRFHYHIPTSTLMYYCGVNNSLLILDENDYTVKRTIATNITNRFDEVKLISDGNSIVILAMGTPISQNPPASQLIKISLLTNQITNNVTFNSGLSPGEAVSGYASGSSALYIITNKVQGSQNLLAIYSMILLGNNYQLTLLTNFSSNIDSINFINEIFCLGDYIVVNNARNILTLNKKGQVMKQISGASYKVVSNYTTPPLAAMALVAEYGSSHLYAIVNNIVMKYTALQLILGTGVAITDASDMQVALGKQASNDVIFTINPQGTQFFAWNPQTKNVIYNSFIGYESLMITNSTYAVVHLHQESSEPKKHLYIIDLETSVVIADYLIGEHYYHHQDTQTFIYLNKTNSTACNLTLVNLATTTATSSFLINDEAVCNGTITQANLGTASTPDIFILTTQGLYFIQSSSIGQATFILPAHDEDIHSIVTLDFETMSLYAVFSHDLTFLNISNYQYDSATKTFVFQSAKLLFNTFAESFYVMNYHKVVFLWNFMLRSMDIVTFENRIVSFYNKQWGFLTSFIDKSGNDYLILADSENDRPGQFEPGLYYSDKLEDLPGTTRFTAQAGSAGVCSYWVLDSPASDVKQVNFFNICSEEKKMSHIYA